MLSPPLRYFPLFIVVPGYVLAWALDLFNFRERTLGFRLCLAAPLSVAVFPIVTYLAGRFISFHAVWTIYAAAAAALPFLLIRDRTRLRLPAGWGVFALVLGSWLVISVFSLIDLQVGERLYYPVTNLDYAVRTGFVNSLSETGIPPENPFFQAGHSTPLRYHYFWLMMCSLVQRAGGGTVGPRHALIGGTFWIGVSLISLIGVYLRLFYRGASPATPVACAPRYCCSPSLASISSLLSYSCCSTRPASSESSCRAWNGGISNSRGSFTPRYGRRTPSLR